MSDDLEEIEGVARIAGNLKIRISKALNVGAGKREDLQETEDREEIRDPGKTGGLERTGDPGKREGNDFQGVKNSTLDSLSLKSAYHKLPIQ